MNHRIATILLALFLAVSTGWSMTEQERKDYLAWMEKTYPKDATWDAWEAKAQELPPDFDAFPKHNMLPDPLQFMDGHKVTRPEDWPARREEIYQLEQKWDLGSFPPKPKLDNIVVEKETEGDGFVTRDVRLEFGPGDKGYLHTRVTTPDGDGPFPVLIASTREGWATSLVRRGYISAGYAGNDFDDDGDAAHCNLAALYPEYDFATLPRRGWSAQLVIDYLQTLPQTDMKHIGIFGYSRDGKMVTTGAAVDTRISAVIAGSTGVGGVLPWRLSGEVGFGEGIETTTRSYFPWYVPRLRFFAGREDRLPIDGNCLVALLAPRACLIEYGNNDEVSQSWGMEQSYESALKVYQLLGKPDALSIMHVPGFHGANDQEKCIDWLDIQFGRSKEVWHNDLQYQWDYDAWKEKTKNKFDPASFPDHPAGESVLNSGGATIATTADWEKKADEIRKTVKTMLGEEPPIVLPADDQFSRGFGRRGATSLATTSPAFLARGGPGQVTPDLVNWVIQRGGPDFGWPEPEEGKVTSKQVSYGIGTGGLFNVGPHGDLYYLTSTPADAKLPVVIWLHGYSSSLGYMWVYHNASDVNGVQDLHPILALTRAGYAVMAYDQSGFGSRIGEAGPFYDRYPNWSRLGKQVEDVRMVVDALAKDPMVDPQRIYVYGYSMGGMVALHAAALDNRIKGAVSLCGFTPMRTDTDDKGTGGIARLVFEHPLLPQLGAFIGHESRIPYDYNELISAIAPRPVYVLNPKYDRDATPNDVESAVTDAGKVYALYNASDNLKIDEPVDYNRLPETSQDRAIAWMGEKMK